LQLPVDEKQDLLETVDPLRTAGTAIGDIFGDRAEKLNVDRNIKHGVKRQMERRRKSIT